MILLMWQPLQQNKRDAMPTYNYYCGECDDHFSCFQKMSEEPFSICKECGNTIQRIITGGTGLIFKGSGFYLTDYKTGYKTKSDTVKKDEGTTEKSIKDKKEATISNSSSKSRKR